MAQRSIAQTARPTPGGAATILGAIDTHKDQHTVAALDAAGRLLGTAPFPSTAAILVRTGLPGIKVGCPRFRPSRIRSGRLVRWWRSSRPRPASRRAHALHRRAGDPRLGCLQAPP